MAEKILDGTVATIDISLVPPGGGTTNSYKCRVSSVAIEAYRTLFTRITFCSSNWINNINGMKGMRGSLTGYPANGSAGSSPFAYFVADGYGVLVFTVDTGCTITLTVAVSREVLGMIAAGNGSWSMEFENKNNDLAIVWVTS